MARFFIDRPVFAWVIAIVIMLAGGLAITQLAVERYPTIAPPSVTVNANYPGASAKVVEDTVTQIIEQNMKGLDGLIYMSSTSESTGRASARVYPYRDSNPALRAENPVSLPLDDRGKVLRGGFEPPRYYYHMALNHARLPIPPPEHFMDDVGIEPT